ncbi:isoleucine--tRNA ligase [Candidatus Pacearchaeota archaeon]|nr:isoleucine--tRNA ligase [Candidatus Pacearchaeota archaeon]
MYDFKQTEEEAAKILKESDIKKAVLNDSKRKKLFSFLEGPPTANAPPALHHLEVRTYKDIINKFRYMQGFNVPRKAGWDCHGLPVEVQIEKKLGLNSKKDIQKHGEAKFIDECRESVFSYIESWNKSTRKLNYWVDLEGHYATLDNNYIESVWWSLQQLYNKKLLYEAHKVVPFCPRCETPLSSHEVAQGYKKVKEDSVIVKLRLSSGENLLVWTTTPWTLPSNVAVAVNPNIDYVFVEEREIFILAKEQAKKLFEEPNIIKTVKGKDLIGKEYSPLFNYFAGLKGAFKIIPGDFVTTEDGTGLVHLAPAFGEVDYDVCKKEKVPFVQPVDETGKFTAEVPDFQGQFIKKTDKLIIEKLKFNDQLFKVIPYEHDYPFCWRCSSPLMYYAIKSWFIEVTKYKDRLIELNEKINWTPKYIKEGRFGEWLRNVKDWALSRNKFWGTPMPVWRCECGYEKVIGSVEELKKNSIKKFSEKEIDLHKPWIDNIKFKCEKCKKEMKRIPEVIDCWYDSGSASFAQFHYPFENKEEFKKRFPYDFISEAVDQTRGWFYTLHVLGTILFDDVAFKNVICAGHIVDEKGEKMSKSKGNVLNPDEVISSIGVDATRLQFCTMDIGASKRFGINLVKEEVSPFLNVLWNTFQFYTQLNNNEKAIEKVEDKWILSKLNKLVKETTENLENYQIEKALLPIMEFVTNDFSKTYIKMIRDRDDKNVKKVIGKILDDVSKLLAPFAPNISEVIHKEFEKGSVHLSTWSKYDEKLIDLTLEKEFGNALMIIEMGLSERDKAHIGLKWPLAKATLFVKSKTQYENLKKIIKNQLNIKELEIKSPKLEKDESYKEYLELDTKLTPELEAEGYAREISRFVQAERKKAGLVKTDFIELHVAVEDKEFLKLISRKEAGIIKERVNAKKISNGLVSDVKNKYSFTMEGNIKGKKFKIYFNKLN